jgi:DNA-binding MarR family transcriptional regulator
MRAQERTVLGPVADALRLVTQLDADLRRQANLGLRAALVLAALGDGPARVGAVARDAALSPPTASHVLERLETAGLIVRKMAAGDRRAVDVELTPVGRVRREEVYAALARLFQRGDGAVPAPVRMMAAAPTTGGTP